MTALAADVTKLVELVDGQQDWSHRKRLHQLEDDRAAVTIAAQALQAYRDQRNSWWTRIREWGSFVLAGVAIYLAAHGG